MRFFVLLLALLFAGIPVFKAEARDDIMPPPRSAPRIPVEIHPLEGSKNNALTEVARMAVTPVASPIAAKAPRAQADSQEYEGKGSALDGERMVVDGKELRLFGIVTPALNSSFGPQTRLSLDRMLSGNNVLCKVTDHDRDGNPLAFCGTVKVPDLSYEMLRQGWAMVDRRTLKGNTLADVYEKAEQEAQTQNRGIFAPAPVAMSIPVSDPAKSVTVPVPEAKAEPVAAAPAAPAAPETADAALPDIRQAVTKLAAAPAPKAEEPEERPLPAGTFVERYQILFGAGLLLLAAGVFTFAVFWREKRAIIEKRRSLAAALRGELMSARLICRTRSRELLRQKKGEIEASRPSQLWPRIRSFVYQAHVAHLGLLGAELARQVASVYGQFADYAAYYQSNSATRTPIPRVVGETLGTLADHVETLLQGLAEVESTGQALIGEDIMAEEEARAAAENIRLAMAAAAKRALPAPRTAEAILRTRRKTPVAEQEEPEETEAEDDVPEAADEEEAEETAKPARSTRAA